MLEFGKAEEGQPGLVFRNDETGDVFMTAVKDKFPQLGDVHIEGRRYVEVSVELFAQLVGLAGYHTVDPNAQEEEN